MTTAPTGLTIARSGKKFTFSWKTHDYTAQQLKYIVNDKGSDSWKSVTISKGTTSKTISCTWVRPLDHISFKVRGKKGGKWSDWSTKTFTTVATKTVTPKVEASSDVANQVKFSWETNYSDSSTYCWDHNEYRTKVTGGSWSGATSASASGSKTLTVSTAAVAAGGVTQYFATRTVGARHASGKGSAWTSKYYRFAYPNKATGISGTYKQVSSTTQRLTANWTLTRNQETGAPCDTMIPQYALAVPGAMSGKTPTVGDDVSWNDLDEVAWKQSSNAVSAELSETIGKDQVVFFRVQAVHGMYETYSNAVALAPSPTTAYRLKTPELTSVNVTTSGTTATFTIECTTQSENPDCMLQAQVVDSAGETVGQKIVDNTAESVNVVIENYDSSKTYTAEIWSYVDYSFGTICSDTVSETAVVPITDLTVSPTTTTGEVLVTWSWAGTDVSGAEISWADHSNAWESTDEPETYEVASAHAGKWYVTDLDTGVTWYFRMRLYDGESYGTYTESATVSLTENPLTPQLTLAPAAVTVDGYTTASWAYTSGDGTIQSQAEIVECAYTDGAFTYGNVVASTTEAQNVTITPSELGWTEGTVHYLAVRTTSASNMTSDYSAIASLVVAPALELKYTTNITETTLIDDDGEERTVNVLSTLPLTVTIEGGSEATVTITRAADYTLDRPDGYGQTSYEGEVIISANAEAVEDEQATVQAWTSEISLSDLLGRLDDGAQYICKTTITDDYGQTATEGIEFEVHWDTQPTAPSAECEMVDGTAQITGTTTDGETLNIYRLSTDSPELIAENVESGTTIVDPYPAYGSDACGHRVVAVSAYGDYWTDEGTPTWVDLGRDDGDCLDRDVVIINFGDDEVTLPYDIEISNDWAKQFERTVTLGGNVVGDWAEGIERDISINTTVIVDGDNIPAMRRLAEYSGICHVRTPEGSSFVADVQVSEDINNIYGSYDLTIKRVDSEQLDGMTLADWTEAQEE